MNIDAFSPGRVKLIKFMLPVSIAIFAYHAISIFFELDWYYEDAAMLGWGWAAVLLWLMLRKWNLIIIHILLFMPFILFILYDVLTSEPRKVENSKTDSFESYIDNLD
jgi:hypothetical protein